MSKHARTSRCVTLHNRRACCCLRHPWKNHHTITRTFPVHMWMYRSWIIHWIFLFAPPSRDSRRDEAADKDQIKRIMPVTHTTGFASRSLRAQCSRFQGTGDLVEAEFCGGLGQKRPRLQGLGAGCRCEHGEGYEDRLWCPLALLTLPPLFFPACLSLLPSPQPHSFLSLHP